MCKCASALIARAGSLQQKNLANLKIKKRKREILEYSEEDASLEGAISIL
jgi:hypothetical protein